MNLGSLLPSTHFLELVRADIINNEFSIIDKRKSVYFSFFSFYPRGFGNIFIKKSIKISKRMGLYFNTSYAN